MHQNLPDANTAQRIAALLLPLSSVQANNRATLLKAPKACQELAILACTLRCSSCMNITDSENEPAEQLLEALNAADAWRRPERLQEALQLLRVTLPLQNSPNLPLQQLALQRLADSAQAAAGVQAKTLLAQGYRGPELGQAMSQCRLKAIRNVIQKH